MLNVRSGAFAPIVGILASAVLHGPVPAHAQQGQVPALMTEQQFVEQKMKLSADSSKANALARLQASHPSVTKQRFNPLRNVFPGSLAQKFAEQEEKRLRAALTAGLTISSIDIGQVTYAIDWSKVDFVIRESNQTYSRVMRTTQTDYLGKQDITPPNGRARTYWNCSANSLDATLTRNESLTNSTSTSQTAATEQVRVLSASTGTDITMVSASWSDTLTKRFETTRQIAWSEMLEDDIAYPFKVSPLSSVDGGRMVSYYTQRYGVTGDITFDVDVEAYVPAIATAVQIGRWSELASEQQRTASIRSFVLVPMVHIIVGLMDEVQYPSLEACRQARLEQTLGGDRFITLDDVRTTPAAQAVAKQVPAAGPGPIGNLAAGLSSRFRSLNLAATTAATTPVSARCSPLHQGSSVNYNTASGNLSVKHNVQVGSCPIPDFESTGRFLYGLRVLDARGRPETLVGFESRWKNQGASSFSIADAERLNVNDVTKVLSVTGVQFTNCSCNSK